MQGVGSSAPSREKEKKGERERERREESGPGDRNRLPPSARRDEDLDLVLMELR